MSSSITIPTTPSSASPFRGSQSSSSKTPASSASSYSDSPSVGLTPALKKKNKAAHGRRPSLLSTAISKQECTVINIGDPDGPPRLLSYLSSSQGYLWNPEIFLPPYVDCDYTPLENRRDPVHDIVLSDEETKSMLPQ